MNGDGRVTGRDALNVINALDDSGDELSSTLDTDRDGKVDAGDAALVINRLAADVASVSHQRSSAEGKDQITNIDAVLTGLF